jgi:hypothetical protein
VGIPYISRATLGVGVDVGALVAVTEDVGAGVLRGGFDTVFFVACGAVVVAEVVAMIGRDVEVVATVLVGAAVVVGGRVGFLAQSAA